MEAFKERYKERLNKLRITDIGFEDYYLIHDLACNKTKTHNLDQFYIRESMKAAYFYAIYNDGKLNELFLKYPRKFVDYLSQFDSIFTTNYDSNIESVTKTQIYHIHGQFDKKSEVFNAASLRNQLPDAPIKDSVIDETYFYLYSNAVSTYCGQYKEIQLKQYSQANVALEKSVIAYNNNPEIHKEIDSWTKSKNIMIANMGHMVQIKAANPNISFNDNYYFDRLKEIKGTLDILGLSSWNDFHIFESIDSSDIDNCTFYYYRSEECETIKKILPILYANNKLNLLPGKKFWEDNNEN